MNDDYEGFAPAEPEILAKAWPATAPAERTLAKGLSGRQCSEERPYAPRCADEAECEGGAV